MSSDLPKQLSTIHMATGGSTALALFHLIQDWMPGRRLLHPPGPKALPIIGNLLDMPESKFALAWNKFGEQYGPLTWLTVVGQPLLILNSFEASKELLGSRGSIYVDRPRSVVTAELLGFDDVTPFAQSQPGWRKQRTLLKHALTAKIVKRDYSALLSRKAKKYIECLLDRPDKFLVELKRIVAENMIELSYGRLRDEQGRDYVELGSYVTEVVETVIQAPWQGHIVDLIPSLKYLSSWLPGMEFKRDAAKWNKGIEDINRSAFERTQESVISGASDVQSCFMVNKLQELHRTQKGSHNTQQLEDKESAIRHSRFSFFIAGIDTTFLTLHAFLLAMTVFPSVQEKIHAEIDRVVGSGRHPTLDDLEDMPYLQAAIIENYRWCPLISGGNFYFTDTSNATIILPFPLHAVQGFLTSPSRMMSTMDILFRKARRSYLTRGMC
ncbi:hypothetical protein FRC04_009963 [Tulasnella sp. 424]|nr:hypothetical protein FRC04_009963 [Tulasnella sp. 424]